MGQKIWLWSVWIITLISAACAYSPSASAQSYPDCRVLERWEQDNENWSQYGRARPYPVRNSNGAEFRYDFQELLEGDVHVFSDRYYAIPPLRSFTYNLNLEHDFSFVQRYYYHDNHCFVPGNRDDKVKRFIRRGRIDGLAMNIFFVTRNASGVGNSEGMPIFKIGLQPLNFDLSDYPELKFAEVSGSYKWSGTRKWTYALALPDTEGQQAGELRFSDWQFCESCMLKFLELEYAHWGLFTPRNPAEGSNGDWSTNLWGHWRQAMTGLAKGVPGYVPPENADAVSPAMFQLTETPQRGAEIVFGEGALAKAQDFGWRYANAQSRNREYLEFVDTAFRPLTVETHMRGNRCAQANSPAMFEAPEVWASAGDALIRRAECLSDHLATYDPVPLAAIYDDILEEEGLLFKETLGIERAQLPTFEQQLDREMRNIDALYESAERYFQTANYTARRWEKERRANAERRAAMQSAFVGLQREINSMQAGIEEARRDHEAFVALNLQKQRRKAWQREREIAMQAREQLGASGQEVAAGAKGASEEPDGTSPATYEGFDRTPEIQAGVLPCADIPTPEEVARLEQGLPVPGFDAGWERCLNRNIAGADGLPPNSSGEDEYGASEGSSDASTSSFAHDKTASDDSITSSVGGGNANGSARTDGSTGYTGGTGDDLPPATNGPRYIFVRDLVFEHRGFAFSSREQAIRGLQNSWANSALTEHCEKAWRGGDGYRGPISVSNIEVEQIGSTRWVGSAKLDGYCRLLPADADYERAPLCPSERPGQTNCYVTARHTY